MNSQIGSKKWKFFGIRTRIEWYDIKAKFKLLLRKITYSSVMQKLICLVFVSYMKLVYHTSKKKFVNQEILPVIAQNKTPLIVVFWHNRMMMIPFVAQKLKKLCPDYNFMTLASRHGDGRVVGKIMEKFGLISILGSSKDGRKSSRGINIKSFRKIFDGLKSGHSLGLTPDGPRGPNQKINGEIINIARISQAGILAISYSSSRFKRLNSWDKFTIPLPFSTLCFYFDKDVILVDKNASSEEIEKIRITVQERMDFIQERSQEMANK
jgi:lysophospholipid acyltransferase (LPLAT)-like uncharacterized protein